MVRSAARYILRSGPSTLEDRWEDACGFTPFTLSALIAALLVASEMGDGLGEAIGRELPARDRRRLARQSRSLDLCRGHRAGQASRRPRVLPAHRTAGSSR